MRRKLREARGETVVEVLVAILIGAMSVAMLFGATAVSADIDQGAKEREKAFVESLNAAEGRTGLSGGATPAGTEAKVTVKSADGGAEKDIPVTFYGGRGAISYALTAGDTGI